MRVLVPAIIALAFSVAGPFARAQQAGLPEEAAPPRGAALPGEASPPQEAGLPTKPSIPDVPESLDEKLAIALRSNPEILQAEARVRQAQARLNEIRLRVTKDVITSHHEREVTKKVIKGQLRQLDSLRQRLKVGTASQDEAIAIEVAVAGSEAKLDQNLAQTRYILGLGGDYGLGGESRSGARSQPPSAGGGERRRPPIPPDYREILEKKVSYEHHTDIQKFLEETTGRPVIIAPGTPQPLGANFRLSDTPLKDILTAVAEIQELCFLFRDYGILVTIKERAATIHAPAIPEETPLQ